MRFEEDADDVSARDDFSFVFTETGANAEYLRDVETFSSAFRTVTGASRLMVEETHASKVDAAKIISAIAREGFYGGSADKRHMHADEIKKVLDITLKRKVPHGEAVSYTFASLMAACFAHRTATTVMQPGEEVFDMELERELKMSKAEEFEFRVACSVVIGQEEVSSDHFVPLSCIDDVFLALGYTMQEKDLIYILDHCDVEQRDPFAGGADNRGGLGAVVGDVDGDGEKGVKVDNLMSAFEAFRDDQVMVLKIKAIFNSIIASGALPHSLRSEHKKAVGSTTIPHESLRNIMNKLLQLSRKDGLTEEETRLLVDEISSRYDRKITLRDFVRIFSGSREA